MKKAPILKNEKERLAKLQSYKILDTPPSYDFDQITSLAAHLCECKIALVSLVDKDRQWFKSKFGLDAAETPRDISYCGHAIEGEDVFIVEDAEKDERFCDNPLYVNEPHVRFYAGAPLITPDGYKVGTLCVIDSESKSLTDHQIKSLKMLSKLVVEIFERNLENAELTHLKRQYEDVQYMSSTGGWELCLVSNKTIWSREIYNIHGIPYGESPDKVDAISFYAPHERLRLGELIANCAKDGTEFDDQFEFYNKQGERRWVRSIGRPVYEKDGSIKKLIGTFQDVTEQIEMEKALGRNAKLASIGQLAAGVGHEINNPLTIIKGYVDAILNRKSNLPKDIEIILEKINASSERIENIVKGLRTFARVEKGANSDIFNVKSLLFEMQNMLTEIYHNDGVELSFDFEGVHNEVCLNGDRGKFEQILINLISNAKDATEKLSERIVKVQANYLDGELSLSVSDNGEGVPDDLKEKIFDPFFTTKDVGKGTGIGLSLVHKFINNEFYGTIEVENSVPDVGASFKIKVPAAISGVEPVKEIDEVEKSFKLRAILADDEEGIRDLLKNLLEGVGVKTKTFENGKLALDEYTKNPDSYDLVISDMKMPEMDGPTFLRNLRNNTKIKQPKFFFTTGGINIDFEDQDNELNKLIDGYFYKPFSKDSIFEQLEKVFPFNKKV